MMEATYETMLIEAKKKNTPPRVRCDSKRGVTYDTTKFQNHCVAAAVATPYELSYLRRSIISFDINHPPKIITEYFTTVDPWYRTPSYKANLETKGKIGRQKGNTYRNSME